jgi:hypothetical protein
MDNRTFDSLIRSLSAATAERRDAIKGLFGAALGLSIGQVVRQDTEAKKKKCKPCQKKKKGKCKGKKPDGTPCGDGMACENGQCVPDSCERECSGQECGDDGCGGSCGDCDDGYSCTDTANGTTCQPGTCEPDCAGKECGGNGCGGSCGSCQGSETCNGGACQCASGDCGGVCCAGNQTCISDECWPDSEERAFVNLINSHRAANGLGPLVLQNQLGRTAELHSRDQASTGNSSHTGSNGSTPEQRIAAAGYSASYTAENIYWNSGDGSANAAFTWWKNSPGHNANMLSTNLTQFGIGRARRSANGYWYWTTTFGRPS